MPANFESGFSVREPSWHGLATVLDAYPESWDEAREYAGLQWEPETVASYTIAPLTRREISLLDEGTFYFLDGEVPAYWHDPERRYNVAIQSEGFASVRRDDTHKVLAQPTDRFSLISHKLMGEIIEAILGETNVKFETAGSLDDGRKVWALVRLDEPYQVPGDDSPTYPFLALLNPHDGSGCATGNMTQIRVICWNTWQAADMQAELARTQFKFKHIGNVEERVAEAKTMLAQLRETSDRQRELFEALARVPVNAEEVKTFTELFLPSPADHGDFVSDRVAANIAQARGAFGRLYNESVTTEGVRGSAYGLLQASTEYLDHVRRHRTTETLVGRQVLRPEPLKARALDLIEEVVGADWRVRDTDEVRPAPRRQALVQAS